MRDDDGNVHEEEVFEDDEESQASDWRKNQTNMRGQKTDGDTRVETCSMSDLCQLVSAKHRLSCKVHLARTGLTLDSFLFIVFLLFFSNVR